MSLTEFPQAILCGYALSSFLYPFQTMFELSNKLLTQSVIQCLHHHVVTKGITTKCFRRRTIVKMPPPEVSSIVTSLSTQAAQNV